MPMPFALKATGLVLSSVPEQTSNIVNKVVTMRKKCKSNKELTGFVAIVTGANSGIGKFTALDLAKRGAKVIMACRDVVKGKEVEDYIMKQVPEAKVVVKKLDLSSLASVRAFALEVNKEETKLDILINNAGVMMTPEWKTEDGFEMQFGTNHLGHFLLTLLLLDALKAAPEARVVNVASSAIRAGTINFENMNLTNDYNPTKAYCQSKLANRLFTLEMANRLGKDSTIRTYSLHPGIINSNLQRHVLSDGGVVNSIFNVMCISEEEGAQTSLHCALDDKAGKETGQHYSNCEREKCLNSEATDDVVARKLWDISCKMVNIPDPLPVDTK